jgi:glyoxylase-like metal-dependent hydrolase (beta-lactamase superfamily II)
MKMTPEDINFPAFQGHCVKVSAINGARSHMLAQLLVDPAPSSQKYLNLSSYCFLIESQHCNQKVVYDLAFMRDLDTRMPPALKALFAGDVEVMGIDEFHHIPDSLVDHGVELAEINAVIWSHAHLDHVGDPSVFPPSTELVVGPGLKARCMPGYPTNPDAFVLDSAFEGRSVREVEFSSNATTIGGFRAVDFFGDGSFFILEAPGHTQDHICALCRTTEDSWVLLGGDACHNIAQLRPNPFRPLPETLDLNLLGRVSQPEQCGCNHVPAVNGHGSESPVYNLAGGMQENIGKAKATLEKLKAFDGRDDVLIIIAHDSTLLDVLDFFPRDINDWKAKGWATRGRWLFLKELEGQGEEVECLPHQH